MPRRCNRRIAKIVERLAVTQALPPALPVALERWDLVERRDFVWDGWNIVHEFATAVDGVSTNVTEIQYFWGLDLSDSLRGAGGVGGLLAVSRDGGFYFPVYDSNGNVMKYVDESGAVAAAYVYDDFGKIVSQTGILADAFTFRFSTKYFDRETSLCAYQCRFYDPDDKCWISRDPIEEDGGVNLYSYIQNQTIDMVDYLGQISVKDIPKIMRGNNWPTGAALMERWLANSAKEAAHPCTDIVKMSWVLGFSRARKVYDDIFESKVYANSAAKTQIAKVIKKQLGNSNGHFGNLSSNVLEVDKSYINYRSVGGTFDPVDDMFAALGQFSFRMAVAGEVTGACVELKSVGVYVKDSYDFIGFQYLGNWSVEKNYGGKNIFIGDSVWNSDFREYSSRTGMGHDFLVYSDVLVRQLSPSEFFRINR